MLKELYQRIRSIFIYDKTRCGKCLKKIPNDELMVKNLIKITSNDPKVIIKFICKKCGEKRRNHVKTHRYLF